MSAKSTLRTRKFMGNKLLIFTTLLLSLSVVGKAYCKRSYIQIENTMRPLQTGGAYPIKGFTIETDGKGKCMHSVTPSSTKALFAAGPTSMDIYFDSGGKSCWFRSSAQSFNVINNDTQRVVGSFRWYKHAGEAPGIEFEKNIGHFMVDVTHGELYRDKLNISTRKTGVDQYQQHQQG
ncbi:hypothetical protein [Candidatus Sororendozoicomonas aggregata]|uniref:hypothetical protein n=1 Tax=Candidatus Sororendozoicomonas aggregata TaxID=3073239 RepID=UPI002ED454AC